MEAIWQQIVIGVALVVAVAYLVVYYRRRRRAKGACRACASAIESARKKSTATKSTCDH